MDGLLNHMRRAASEAMNGFGVTRHGTIDGYDPANHVVKVKLQPDGTITDWMPLKALSVGNGFGAFFAPNIGDAVEVDFQEASSGVASAGFRFFNDSERPLNVPAGEMWLVHKSGSSIKLTTDGKVTLTDKAGSIVVMNADGTGTMTFGSGLTINANITVNGTVAASGDVTGNGTSLHNHKHGGVTTGSGQTGAPV